MAERRPTDSMKPIDRGSFGVREARHLLWRAGFGGTWNQIETLASWGPEKSVDHLLKLGDSPSYPWPDKSLFNGEIMQPLTASEREAYRTAAQRQDEDTLARFRMERQLKERDDRAQMREIQRWWLTRMIESPRPLEEKLALFWHGHFATSYRTIENSYHLFMQNQMFRKNAAGSFGDLLFAIIRDPAMLKYLDNDESRKGRPNENLARELMELFSLGEGAYSEEDIKEGARALTGYTFDHNTFVLDPDRHDAGIKSILGAKGRLDGDDFVRAILETRACSLFMARKLYRFFVGEIPEKGTASFEPVRHVVQTIANTMLSSRYELKPVLRQIFLSEHFYDDAVVLSRIKSPAELIVGAVRSLRTPVRDLGVLLDAMDLMGQSLFFPPSVKGWDGERAWINSSTLFVRQNVLAFLISGKTADGFDPMSAHEVYEPEFLIEELAGMMHQSVGGHDKEIRALLWFMLGSEPSEGRVTAAREFVDSKGSQLSPIVLRELLTLIAAMPEYQLI